MSDLKHGVFSDGVLQAFTPEPHGVLTGILPENELRYRVTPSLRFYLEKAGIFFPQGDYELLITPEINPASVHCTCGADAYLDARNLSLGWTVAQRVRFFATFHTLITDAHKPDCPDCGGTGWVNR